MKKWVFFAAALALVLAALPAAANEEIYYWPLVGTVKGTNVNVRSGPGTSFKAVGKLSGGDMTPALPVTGTADTGEERPWYRVEHRAFGQGWIYGQFLSVEEPLSALSKYALRIKTDYGLTPSLAVKKLGKPVRQDNKKLRIPDFNVTVAVSILTYPGFESVYWDGQLKSVTVSGKEGAFGDITAGMDADDAVSLLGRPAERDENKLVYYGSFSEQTRSQDEIVIEVAPGPAGEVVTGLEFQHIFYD
ncbi:MAG: SH3 domain-containing protein [Aminivibrio sp.]